jgi:hypothetical protein
LKIWFFFIIVLKKIPKKKNFFFTLRIFSDTLSIFILHFFLCTAKTGALPPRLGIAHFFAGVWAKPLPRQKKAEQSKRRCKVRSSGGIAKSVEQQE